MELPVHRLAFSQRSGALFPCFEPWGFIEGVALLFVGERSQDAELRGFRAGRWHQHACSQNATMVKRALEKFPERLLKFSLAPRTHMTSDGDVDGHNHSPKAATAGVYSAARSLLFANYIPTPAGRVPRWEVWAASGSPLPSFRTICGFCAV